ncbi:MAG: TIGR02117 family protein [Pseudomonadota bacterium]
MNQPTDAIPVRKKSRWRWVAFAIAVPLGLLALYFLAVLIFARIPVNADFRSEPGGVPVIVADNGIHVDLILPVATEGHDWRDIFDPAETALSAGQQRVATHIGIGWGHRDFYINTPTWDDMTARTAVRAVLGIGGSVMHVKYGSARFDPQNSVFILLPPENYQRLIAGIVDTTVLDEDGRAVPLGIPGHLDSDAFFEAEGRYNALYTCNNWAASILADAGVRVPLWSPFSGAVIDQIRSAH